MSKKGGIYLSANDTNSVLANLDSNDSGYNLKTL